jgi:hypothetical protein
MRLALTHRAMGEITPEHRHHDEQIKIFEIPSPPLIKLASPQPWSEFMGTAFEVGKKLVQLCQQGKSMEAIETLYAPNIVSVEAHGGPQMPARMEGIAAIKGKAEWWDKNHQVHSAEVNGPWPHGDRFIVFFKYEVTAKAGPMAGKRFTMEETGLYTVKNDKVVQEEFFYSMGG